MFFFNCTDADNFDGFNVTTERNAFDKTLSRGKRKSARQGGTKMSSHQQKRMKSSPKENHWSCALDAGNSPRGVRHFAQSSPDIKMQGISCDSLKLHDAASKEQGVENQPCGSGRLLHYDINLKSNPQNSHYKCNVYFATATRDSTTPEKISALTAEHGKTSSSFTSASKWAKFMPNLSTSKNTLPEPKVTINTQTSSSSGECRDNTTLPSLAMEIISQDKHNNQARSLLGEDLFEVDDDLEGEWWNLL